MFSIAVSYFPNILQVFLIYSHLPLVQMQWALPRFECGNSVLISRMPRHSRSDPLNVNIYIARSCDYPWSSCFACLLSGYDLAEQTSSVFFPSSDRWQGKRIAFQNVMRSVICIQRIKSMQNRWYGLWVWIQVHVLVFLNINTHSLTHSITLEYKCRCTVTDRGDLPWFVFLPPPARPVLSLRISNLMASFLPKVFIPMTSHLPFTTSLCIPYPYQPWYNPPLPSTLPGFMPLWVDEGAWRCPSWDHQ